MKPSKKNMADLQNSRIVFLLGTGKTDGMKDRLEGAYLQRKGGRRSKMLRRNHHRLCHSHTNLNPISSSLSRRKGEGRMWAVGSGKKEEKSAERERERERRGTGRQEKGEREGMGRKIRVCREKGEAGRPKRN